MCPTEHLTLDRTAGDAYDNGLMETINGLSKAECVRTTVFHTDPYKTITDVEFSIDAWVDWYNNRRPHGTLGMTNPQTTSPPTTLHSPSRSNLHSSGREPGTLQHARQPILNRCG